MLGLLRIIAVLLVFAGCLHSAEAKRRCGKGFVGGAVCKVGKATGIRPLEKAGKALDDTSRGFKEDVPPYKAIEEGGSRVIREGGKWVEKHPDKALAIALVAVVGWAACVDGCTFVAGVVLQPEAAAASGSGLLIPVLTVGDRKNKGSASEGARQDHPASPRKEEKVIALNKADDPEPLASEEKTYPKYYSRVEYPSPDGLKNYFPRISYKSRDQEFLDAVLNFSSPAPNSLPRVATKNDVGGTFLSPRTDLGKEGVADAVSLYGKNTGRAHGGTDWLMSPGTKVVAVMSGKVESVDRRTETGFSIVVIKAFDGTIARQLYVTPSVKKGDDVVAGQTVVGEAARLKDSKEYQNVPNHVHVDFTDRKGRRFDPYTNTYLLW